MIFALPADAVILIGQDSISFSSVSSSIGMVSVPASPVTSFSSIRVSLPTDVSMSFAPSQITMTSPSSLLSVINSIPPIGGSPISIQPSFYDASSEGDYIGIQGTGRQGYNRLVTITGTSSVPLHLGNLAVPNAYLVYPVAAPLDWFKVDTENAGYQDMAWANNGFATTFKWFEDEGAWIQVCGSLSDHNKKVLAINGETFGVLPSKTPMMYYTRQ